MANAKTANTPKQFSRRAYYHLNDEESQQNMAQLKPLGEDADATNEDNDEGTAATA